VAQAEGCSALRVLARRVLIETDWALAPLSRATYRAGFLIIIQESTRGRGRQEARIYVTPLKRPDEHDRGGRLYCFVPRRSRSSLTRRVSALISAPPLLSCPPGPLNHHCCWSGWEVIAEDETKEADQHGSLANLDSSPGTSMHKGHGSTGRSPGPLRPPRHPPKGGVFTLYAFKNQKQMGTIIIVIVGGYVADRRTHSRYYRWKGLFCL